MYSGTKLCSGFSKSSVNVLYFHNIKNKKGRDKYTYIKLPYWDITYLLYTHLKCTIPGISLLVQWLRLRVSTEEGAVLISSQGTKILQPKKMVWQKNFF